jgi:hypothetical protein
MKEIPQARSSIGYFKLILKLKKAGKSNEANSCQMSHPLLGQDKLYWVKTRFGICTKNL